MARRIRVLSVWILASLAGISGQGGQTQLLAAEASGNNDIEVLQVRPNFYLIAGAGGNIGVQLGDNGVVLVDTGSVQASKPVLAEIKRLTEKPIRFIINTSADSDHVGGNENLSKAGRSLIPAGGFITADNGGAAAILAQDNVLYRMSAPTGKKSPYPTAAQPSETYTSDKHDVFLNGDGIQTMYQPAAHSDGDSIVFFRRADVIMAGDILDLRQFPVVDVDRGGSIQGEIDALNRLLDMTVAEVPLGWQQGGTIVVPGHGRLCDQADLLEYRDMVTIVRDVIANFIKTGMSLDQIQEADPTKEYRPRYGSESGAWTTKMFVEAVYKSLTLKK
jgi:cyclase